MKALFHTLAAALVLLTCSACGVLSYPEYWEADDSLFVNVITLPIELILTPVIFLLKLFPVL